MALLLGGTSLQWAWQPHAWSFQTARGVLELTVIDPTDGKPVPCRIHLRKTRGRPWRVQGLPFWHDHFVFPGQLTLKLPVGTYEFELQRGPEYAVRTGYFTLQRDSNDTKQVELPRFVDMASEGWYAGDLFVCRPNQQMPLLMEAEELFLAVQLARSAQAQAHDLDPTPTPNHSIGRIHRPASLVQNSGGTYLLIPLQGNVPFLPPKQMEKTPQLSKASSSFSRSAFGNLCPVTELSEVQLLTLMEKKPSAGSEEETPLWMDVVWPYCWDLPLWLALGKVNSVQVLHSHFRRSQWVAEEREGRPRDKRQFPGPWGHGLWGQYIYFQILECGFRLPPSAGSGSGWCPNPVGYNRVYVHLEGPPRWQSWWEHFRLGRVLVTNGPLLRPRVQGKLPGHEFTAPEGQILQLEIALRLSTRQPLEYLEIIQNGQVAYSIPFAQYQKEGRLPKLVFDRSGWFLIRALAYSSPTYRVAMTGPYYVRIGSQRRISRSAVRFFLQWLQEREEMIKNSSSIPEARLLDAYQSARQFWEDLLRQANSD